MKKTAKIYQVKVTLKDIKPPIWRRFQVQSEISMFNFHRVLQNVMGWYDSHLWEFESQGQFMSGGFEDDDGAAHDKFYKKLKLADVLQREKQKIGYTYDMGDGWEHDIVLEKVLEPSAGVKYPLCIAGARACPPEDCGSVPGYYEKLEIIGNPKHPEYKETLEWLGDSYDPEKFDLKEINNALVSTR